MIFIFILLTLGSRKEKNMKLLKTVFPGRRLKTYKK